MSDTLIIAPHGDDEIIGVSSVLFDPNVKPIIIYTEETDVDQQTEIQNLKKFVDVKVQFYLRSIPTYLLKPENTIYIPDPIYETHPAHRLQGAIGEQLVRSGYDVIFYSTNMQAPYCNEVPDPKNKEELLNNVYPSKKSLWEYEKKYVLFEGKCKWIL